MEDIFFDCYLSISILIDGTSLNAFPDRLTLLVASIELLYCSLDLKDWFGMVVGLEDKMIKDCFAQKSSCNTMTLRAVCVYVSVCV